MHNAIINCLPEKRGICNLFFPSYPKTCLPELVHTMVRHANVTPFSAKDKGYLEARK